MKLALTIVLGGFVLAEVSAGPGLAADPAAGRLVANMCRTCHGSDGYATIPIAPHIGGEPQTYLETQLMAYKTGAREHEMMSLVAASLSAQQIADVSAWYASHRAAATIPEGVSEDEAPELCVACHGVDGISLLPEAPNLAGETSIYIDTQLKAYKRGKREHEVMTMVVEPLSNQEIRSIAKWYANVKLEILPPQDLGE